MRGAVVRAQSVKRPTWVAFDVETERLSHEVKGGWDNPFGFGFTVGCTTDNDGIKKSFSTHNSADARQRLLEYVLRYDRVVNFNGLRFDNNVIAGDDSIKLAALNEKTFDVKVLLERACGIDDKVGPHIISLASCSYATLSAGKMQGFTDGREAVRRWRRGEYDAVVDYCQLDADLTAEIYAFGLKHGFVLFNPSRFPLNFNGVADLVVKAKALWRTSD